LLTPIRRGGSKASLRRRNEPITRRVKTMKLLGLIFALAALAASPAATAGPKTLVLGAGNYSCASWLSSHWEEGGDWIVGYWSGRNHDNANHLVGSATDHDGIIGEVRKVCQEQPSITVFQATGLVYSDLSNQSR
jgi:hypothetical protein